MAEDIHNLKKTLERSAEKYLSEGGRFFDEDLEDLRRFYQDAVANGISAGRVVKYLATLQVLNRMIGKPFLNAEEKDIKALVAEIEKSNYSNWTKHDYKVVLRKYMRFIGKREAISWLKVKSVKNGRFPQEILTEEEVKKLSKAAYTTRDRALVLALYESGCRIGEFLPLRLRHVVFDRYGAVLRVSGKTGDRRVRLVASSLALQRWIEEHPRKEDPDSFVWCKIPSPNNPKWKNNHLSYGFTCRLLRELAKKAGK
jgi:integrase